MPLTSFSGGVAMNSVSRWVRAAGRPWAPSLLFSLLALSSALANGPDDTKPRPTATKASASAIDQLFVDGLKQDKVKPSAEASDAEFLRRVYIDMLGRIPNIQEAGSFLESKDKGRKAKLISGLLTHPDFAKNFATEWSIVLLGRKNQGRDVDRAALLSWLRKQVAADRPWNEVAFDLIGASGSNKENGAVNFTMAHMEDGAINLTSITTRAFLGQQIQCTQCHDHPMPPNTWKQADFWSINAFYKGLRSERVMKPDATGAEVYAYTEVRDESTTDHATYEQRNALIGVAFPRYLDGTPLEKYGEVNRREQLARLITEKDRNQLARAFVNRVWGKFMGRGFVQPVDDFGPHNSPVHAEMLERLTEDFLASNFNVKELYRTVASSKAYALTSMTTKDNEKDETLFSHMALKPMTPEQLFDSLITATSAHKTAGGDFDAVRSRWLGQFTVTFANDEEGESSNFQGTIPQALMMMNGDLMDGATGGKAGSFLRDALDKSRTQRAPARFIVNRLYLAALGRYPTNSEVSNASAFLGTNPDSIAVVEDLFWSLLNCNEFVLNH